jgi:hypothetical protein
MTKFSRAVCVSLSGIGVYHVSANPMPMAKPMPISPTLVPFAPALTPQQVTQICTSWDSVQGTNSSSVWVSSKADQFLGDFLTKIGTGMFSSS